MPHLSQPSLPPFWTVLKALPHTVDFVTEVESDPLAKGLALLFEPSPILYSHLFPQLFALLYSCNATPQAITDWSQAVDASTSLIQSWDDDLQAQFIAAHPRIGEISGLSALSAAEQAKHATPPAVLARLAHLNACYERAYPGLRYITFVNGRSRSAIKEEMEDVLGVDHSLDPHQPPVDGLTQQEVGSQQWQAELRRAVVDVGQIAKSRIKSMEPTEPRMDH